MPTFTTTGSDEDDFWLVDGNPDFAILPGNACENFSMDLPIRLHVGNGAFGELHIRKHLRDINDRQRRQPPELVYVKLGQGGEIYNTESDEKIKIPQSFNPRALMILRYRYLWVNHKKFEYLSVVSLYSWDLIDGKPIGRYRSTFRI